MMGSKISKALQGLRYVRDGEIVRIEDYKFIKGIGKKFLLSSCSYGRGEYRVRYHHVLEEMGS